MLKLGGSEGSVRTCKVTNPRSRKIYTHQLPKNAVHFYIRVYGIGFGFVIADHDHVISSQDWGTSSSCIYE